MELGIKGHVAVVTGAGRGIGRGIALALGSEGCRVVVWDRDREPAQAVAEEIRAAGGEAISMAGSVADRDDVARVTGEVVDQLGAPHILVNNAGFSSDASLLDMTDERWNSVMDVNLKGVFLCTQAVAPIMIRQGYGRIINIASRGVLGDVNKSNYAAAKAGVVAFTKSISLEIAKHGVTVNAILPGYIETERLLQLPNHAAIHQRAMAAMPIQRAGKPEDVANGVLFLASTTSGFITGDLLYITGGRYG